MELLIFVRGQRTGDRRLVFIMTRPSSCFRPLLISFILTPDVATQSSFNHSFQLPTLSLYIWELLFSAPSASEIGNRDTVLPWYNTVLNV
jgi:hypothetical protein